MSKSKNAAANPSASRYQQKRQNGKLTVNRHGINLAKSDILGLYNDNLLDTAAETAGSTRGGITDLSWH